MFTWASSHWVRRSALVRGPAALAHLLVLCLGLVTAAGAGASGLALAELGVQATLRNAEVLFDARAVVASPNGADLYVIAQDRLAHLRRDPLSGLPSLVAAYGDGTGGVLGLVGGNAVAVAPDGDFVYAGTSRGVLVFARAADTGALEFRQFVPLEAVAALAPAVDGGQVYAAAYWDDAVVVLARAPATGLLSETARITRAAGGPPGLRGPRALTASPDGRWLKVACDWSDALLVFARTDDTGALNFSRDYTDGEAGAVGLTEPADLAVSADGLHAYVTSGWSDSVTLWQFDPQTGELDAPDLLAAGPAALAGLDGAGALAFAPDGGTLYVRGLDSLVALTRDGTSGVLGLARTYLDGASGLGGLAGRGAPAAAGTGVYVPSGWDDALTALAPVAVHGAILAGTLRAADGSAAAGMEVDAYVLDTASGQWSQVRAGWTGSDGGYTLTGLAAGTYRLCFAGTPGGHFLSACYEDAADLTQARDLSVTAGAVMGDLNAVLAERSLTGRVSDPDGQPLAGAQVTVGLWEEDQGVDGAWGWTTAATAGADGGFAFVGLADASYRVCALYPERAMVCREGVLRDAVLDLRLPPAGHLAGTLTQQGVGPLPGITVWAYTETAAGRHWDPAAWATTDAAGRYDLPLAAGNYLVCFYSDWHLPACYRNALDLAHATAVAVRVGETSGGIDAVLVPEAHVSGRVTDPQGRAVAGVPVEVLSYRTSNYGGAVTKSAARVWTDENGDYALRQLAGGDYLVCFYPYWNGDAATPQYANQCYNGKGSYLPGPDVIRVLPGAAATHIDAVLTLAGGVSGRVTDGGGNGISGVTVSAGRLATLTTGSYFTRMATATTNALGEYVIPSLAPGSYGVCFSTPSGSPFAGECWNDQRNATTGNLVSVQSGQVTAHVDATLYQGVQDAYESDNSIDLARSIAIGEVQSHTLYRTGGSDTDWLRFSLATPSVIRIETQAMVSHWLRLYTYYVYPWGGSYLAMMSSGNLVGSGESGYRYRITGTNCTSSVTAAGTYYILVSPIVLSDPRYTVSLSAAPCTAGVDSDGDGIGNTVDNCPLDANPDQANHDTDTMGDACDTDDDGDGMVDQYDNCPLIANANQANNDGDTQGDVCDDDDDNDGQSDAVELACGSDPRSAASRCADRDGDGILDASDPDRDGDGVPNDQDAFPDDRTRWMSVEAGPEVQTTVGASVALAGSLSDAAGAAPYAVTWSFGDGYMERGGLTASHRYTTPGVYTATLAVSAANGALAEDTVLVRVGAAPGVLVVPQSGLTTTEAGGSAVFGVVLNAAPSADVQIALASSDPTEGTVSPASLTFTPANWDRQQRAIVIGVDDPDADGPVNYRIITTATSADPAYDGIAVADPALTNTDDPQVRLDLAPGLNLVAAQWTVPPGRATCRGLFNALGGATALARIGHYNAAIGRFEACDADGGTDFAVTAGEVYAVEALVSGDLAFEARRGCSGLVLGAGQNYRGHPNPPTGLGCRGWLAELGPGLVRAIQRLDPASGRIETCAFSDQPETGAVVGVDFAISPEEGYILHSPAGGTVPVVGCP